MRPQEPRFKWCRGGVRSDGWVPPRVDEGSVSGNREHQAFRDSVSRIAHTPQLSMVSKVSMDGQGSAFIADQREVMFIQLTEL